MATLRYRTDLDKAVLHFAFAQHAPVEHVVLATSPTAHAASSSSASASSASSASSSSASSSAASVCADEDDCVAGEWHVFWMHVARVQRIFRDVNYHLGDGQIINHFPNHHELTRKDLMYRNIRRYIRDKVVQLPLPPPSSSLSSSSSSASAAAAASMAVTATSSSSVLLSSLLSSRGSLAGVRSVPSSQHHHHHRSSSPPPPPQPLELVVAQQYEGMQMLHTTCTTSKTSGSSSNNNNNSKSTAQHSMQRKHIRNNNSNSTSYNNSKQGDVDVNDKDDGDGDSNGAAYDKSGSSCSAGYDVGDDGGDAALRVFRFAAAVPMTFNIPNDLSMFAEVCKQHPRYRWIAKPTARSQGKGIFLVRNVQQLTRQLQQQQQQQPRQAHVVAVVRNAMSSASRSAPQQRGSVSNSKDNNNNNNIGSQHTRQGSHRAGGGVASMRKTRQQQQQQQQQGQQQAYIVSKYITNPLLIAGRKFDLRLYVLVTSFRPLVAYVHEGGFARFCATPYSGSANVQGSNANLGAHLTNVALQKTDAHYNAAHGGKLTVQNVWLYVQARYGVYAAHYLVISIHFLIYHSLCAVAEVMYNDKHAFELYGYDILVDDTLQPHLIEVNASPSLSTTTATDARLKQRVLSDTLRIVLPPGYPHARGMSYSEYRTRTDLTTQLDTGFTLLDFAPS